MSTAKIRLDICVEAPVIRRATEILDAHGVSGYTIFSAMGGRGESGVWARSGQITELNQMALITCILDPDRREPLLEEMFGRLRGQIGYVTASEVEVIRPSKFP